MADQALNVALLTILEFAYGDYTARLNEYYFLSRRIREVIKRNKDKEILATYNKLQQVQAKEFAFKKLNDVVAYLSNVFPMKIMLHIAVPVHERQNIEKDRFNFYARVFRNKPFKERQEIVQRYLILSDNWKTVNELYPLGNYFKKNIYNLKKYYLYDNYEKYVIDNKLLESENN
jgi:hypothetical protein